MQRIGARAHAPPVVSPLRAEHLPDAERIFRHAFASFFGARDPDAFWADRDMVYGRQRAPHVASSPHVDTCFVKFGAVRSRPSAQRDFERLLDTCEALAAAERMPILLAGVNMGRQEAYRVMVARGFRTEIQGVAMQRHNEPGFCRPGVFVLDDWR